MSNAIQYWDASKPVTATIAGRGRQQMWGSGRQLCNHASTTALSAMKKLTVIAAVARARRLGVDCDGGASWRRQTEAADLGQPTASATSGACRRCPRTSLPVCPAFFSPAAPRAPAFRAPPRPHRHPVTGGSGTNDFVRRSLLDKLRSS
jgi:hypothetical protein